MKFPHYPVLFCLQVFTRGVPSALNTPSCYSHVLGLLLAAALGSGQKPGPWPAVLTLPAWQGGMDFSGFAFCPLLPRTGWRGATSLTDPERVVCWSFPYATGTEIQSLQPAKEAVRLYLSLARCQDSWRRVSRRRKVVGRGEEGRWGKARDPCGSCRKKLWLLLCVLKGIHFPVDSEELFFASFSGL